MGRIISAIVGVVLGSGLFWCLFLLGIEVRLWREFGISPRDTYNLGFYEAGYWSGFTTLGGLIGLLVGLQVYARLSKPKRE